MKKNIQAIALALFCLSMTGCEHQSSSNQSSAIQSGSEEEIFMNFAEGVCDMGSFLGVISKINQADPSLAAKLDSRSSVIYVNKFYPKGKRSGFECMERNKDKIIITATTDPQRLGKDVTNHPELKQLLNQQNSDGASTITFQRQVKGFDGKPKTIDTDSYFWSRKRFQSFFNRCGAKIESEESFVGCWMRVDKE